MAVPPRPVLVTGATGYIGQRLIPELLARGHAVRALARTVSRARVPAGADVVVGDALDSASVTAAFLAVRAEGEAMIRGAGLTATFVRPLVRAGMAPPAWAWSPSTR